jgi:hypothetical protein
MARRTINRMEKRAEVEAFERRKEEDEEEGDEEDGDEDEEEGDEEEGEASDEDEEDEGEGDEDEEEAPKPKKKPKPPPKPKAKPRTRAVKVTRMRVVWGVFDNSHRQVATYDYPQRQHAFAHAERLTTEKRSTHFVQPVKEAIVEEKEKDKK